MYRISQVVRYAKRGRRPDGLALFGAALPKQSDAKSPQDGAHTTSQVGAVSPCDISHLRDIRSPDA